jgi:hypothetical protein
VTSGTLSGRPRYNEGPRKTVPSAYASAYANATIEDAIGGSTEDTPLGMWHSVKGKEKRGATARVTRGVFVGSNL